MWGAFVSGGASPSPTGWGKVCKNLFVSGCRGRHPLPQILKFSVGAIHESPVFSNAYREAKPLFVILSEGRHECRPKSNFCGVNNGAKAQAFGRSGIWLQISVACYRNVTFVAESHQNSKPYPFVAIAPRFCLFASLNPQNFDCAKRKRFSSLRMTG